MARSCCGPPAAPPRPEVRESTASSCCSPLDDESCAGQAKDEATVSKPAQDKCCGNGESQDGDCCVRNYCKNERGVDGEATGCDDNASVFSTSSCAKGCCGSSPAGGSATKSVSKKPDCCRGKTSPCCDASCLDRLALRECESAACAVEAGKLSCSQATPVASVETKRVACEGHRRSARKRHGATLETLGCICRALLALGQESCCETRNRPSVERKRNSKQSSASSLRRLSADSCCASGIAAKPAAAAGCGTRPRKPARLCRDEGSADTSCSGKPCCQTTGIKAPIDSCADGACCNADKLSREDACADTCCKPAKPQAFQGMTVAAGPHADPENQAAGVEHVVLCISGMTCTGCETKLNRTLTTVNGVRNLKTSLVLSRAEFDVDVRLIAVSDVMKHLERTTEFKCERTTSNGSSIDIVVPVDASSFINQPWPEGVIDMSAVDKSSVRVSFDPEVVGARDLMTSLESQGARLAPVHGDPSLEAGGKHVRHVGYMTALSAILTIPVLVMAWAPLPEHELAYSSASLALGTMVQVFVAGPFYPKALKALVFSRVVEMDLLIVLSTSAAFVFSVVSFGFLVAQRPLSTGQFFETSTLLVTLIMVGRYVAALARQKAVESISIRSLQTQTALLIDDGGSPGEQEIDARLLQYGDLFKVLPDTRIPTDGTVVSGSSEVDESMVTGESRPVEKHAKSQVIAGTINGSGTLAVRLTRLPGDNTITIIAAMVDEAKLSKPKMQELADRVASLFVPVVVALTAVTFVIWVSVGVAAQGKTGSEATVQAMTYAITVLIVSCPCAIGLAVPMVVVIASGVAAARGVVFKSAEAIEVAHRASHVVFDKTGTLTEGRLTVVAEHCLVDEGASLPLLLGLVASSRHPVSAAVAKHLRSKGIAGSTLPNVKSLTGRGMEAKAGGKTLRAGNSRWLDVSSDGVVQRVLAQGYTAFCFAVDGKLAAVYGLEDSLRADAADAVTGLQRRGISVHVVSGDDSGAVRSVAAQLGIPEANARSRSSPADKQAYVNGLLGEAKAVVVFCGDGTNDAVALAQATVGVHVNPGSDVAQSAADVVLVRPDLAGVVAMLDTSRRAVRRIGFNFAWSFVYNTVAVLLAAGALGHARIPPQYAGLGELVSVVPVIAAAVLLRWPGF